MAARPRGETPDVEPAAGEPGQPRPSHSRRHSRPYFRSQTRTAFSTPPVNTALPSGLNAAHNTPCGSASHFTTSLPVVASHNRTKLSRPPVRIVLPSDENEAVSTQLPCPPSEKSSF